MKVTLGPKGRNVVIDKSFGAPRITKDGVTVAKEIELEDKFENMGAQMVREVAQKPTTTPVTAPPPQPFSPPPSSRKAPRPMPPHKSDGPQARHRHRGCGRDKDVENRSKKVGSSAEVAQVGTISSNGNKQIGKMIAEAMQKVGNEGVITVEEAKSLRPM